VSSTGPFEPPEDLPVGQLREEPVDRLVEP